MTHLRWFTAGESHGPELLAILEGLPAGVPITGADISRELARRRLGYGRGARQKFEQDALHITGGVLQGFSLGSPVSLRIENSEWPKWAEVMNPEPCQISENHRARSAPLLRPRPGHADLVGMQKYGFKEARPVLERASARETAARVALGAVAKAFLQKLSIAVFSHTISIGEVRVTDRQDFPRFEELIRIDADPLRCARADVSVAMVEEVERIRASGDTVGGVVEVLAYGLPPGLGSYAQWDRRLDARLAGAVMSIQAIKGVEIGDGFEIATRPGSRSHDELIPTTTGLTRSSNRSGGTEGGMSTGAVLRIKAAMKPIATVPKALKTVDVSTGKPALAHHQRSDVCAVPAAGVVAESMVALVLAQAILEKFGGDSLTEVRRNLSYYLKSIPEQMSSVIDT